MSSVCIYSSVNIQGCIHGSCSPNLSGLQGKLISLQDERTLDNTRIDLSLVTNTKSMELQACIKTAPRHETPFAYEFSLITFRISTFI